MSPHEICEQQSLGCARFAEIRQFSTGREETGSLGAQKVKFEWAISLLKHKKNYRAQTPQSLVLTIILQKFSKTSTSLVSLRRRLADIGDCNFATNFVHLH